MNFSAVRGFYAYSQFSARIREAVTSRSDAPKEADITEEIEQNLSRSMYSEPIDIVSISDRARNASAKLLALREVTPHTEFKRWAREAKMLSGSFSQKVSGSIMNQAISGSGITVAENEDYDVSVDIFSAISVSGRNAEKARDIQDLLNSTPRDINWGLLLLKLPIRQ